MGFDVEANSDGSWFVKARLCIRGFLDPQQNLIHTEAGTAMSRSQRFIAASAANQHLCIASLDISPAFLQGLSFEEAQAAGVIENIKREALFIAPECVLELWIEAKGFWLDDCWYLDRSEIVIECLKGVFGLNDAPRL